MPKRRRWHAVQSSATEHSRATNSAPPCSDSQPPPCSDSQPEYARWRAVSPERTATENSCAQSGRLDPDIRLQKCMNPAAVRLKTHHNRSPDVGIGILIYMPNNRAGTGEVPEMIIEDVSSPPAFATKHGSSAMLAEDVLEVVIPFLTMTPPAHTVCDAKEGRTPITTAGEHVHVWCHRCANLHISHHCAATHDACPDCRILRTIIQLSRRWNEFMWRKVEFW